MSAFRTGFRFNRQSFDRFATPRRPRHPMLRIALGLVGVGLLLALLFVSVFVGIAMLAAGMLFRLWKQRGKPVARAARATSIDGHVLDGSFRVVGKAQLPLAR
jgi:hypothetical protein